jgi:hypothetical protein
VPLVAENVGGETFAEEVTPTPMAAVEAEGVDAVQPFHAVREPLPGGLDDEVVVRPHQTMRVDAPTAVLRRCLEQREEVEAVEVGDEDLRVAYAAGGDVVVAVRELASREPWHDVERTLRGRLKPDTARLSTLSRHRTVTVPASDPASDPVPVPVSVPGVYT